MFIVIICIITIVLGVCISSHQSNKKKNTIKNRIDSIGIKFSKEIKVDGLFFLGISEEERKIVIAKEDSLHVFNYEDIMGVDFVVNGDMVLSRSLGKMIGASVVAGLTGAMLVDQKARTKITSFYVDIRTRLVEVPSVRILPYINDYKTANEITNIINIIIDKVEREQKEKNLEKIQSVIDKTKDNENQLKATSIQSVADELVKLVSLRDKGVLTEEEFNKQKAKLLD